LLQLQQFAKISVNSAVNSGASAERCLRRLVAKESFNLDSQQQDYTYSVETDFIFH